jgi:hypothetical protein
MKTTLLAGVLFLGLTVVHAHDEVDIQVPDYGTISYNAPVIYQAPVLYQAAVIYNAPVFYVSSYNPPAISIEPVVYNTPSVVYTPPSPNVIISGGSRAGAYYTSWDTTPNVIIVGRHCQTRVTPARCRRY